MKVAFFTEIFPKISETFILNQITGLIDAGHDVTIFADHAADENKVHDEVEEYDLLSKTVYVEKPTTYVGTIQMLMNISRRYPISIPELVRSVSRGSQGAARAANLEAFLDYEPKKEFDVFHAHFGTVGNSWDFLTNTSLFPGTVTETPFVVSFYGIDASYVIKQDPNAYSDLIPKVNKVTVLSEDMRSDLTNVGFNRENTVIQPLGVDMAKFNYKVRKPPENGEINLLTVARFDEQKGLKFAIDAVAALSNDYDLTYYIAGDGPLREKIETRIAEHGIQDSVELLGLVNHSELDRYFEKSHVFLLPSVTASDGSKEGTPTVLLEAQASGMPVVSTTHAGIPEIVKDGETGFLVPERDVESLADALSRLLSEPERWSELGKKGRENVKNNHSIPVVVDQLEQIYESVQEESQ